MERAENLLNSDQRKIYTDPVQVQPIRFPGEYEPHEGTLMIWPERPGSWGKDKTGAEEAFLRIFAEIAKREKLYVLVSPKEAPNLRKALADKGIPGEQVTVLEAETDDSWARDTGPTFVFSGDGANRKRLAVNWSFNAWGGTVDGLYADWSKDDLVAKAFSEVLGDDLLDAAPFVLEGGSIHSDGEGTLLVTESCLLSAGRNPKLSKEEIEERLKACLGIRKVLWLPRGIYMDETNEHVDNVACFVRPGEVVLAWTEDEEDPQYELSRLDYEYLQRVTDAKGRKLTIHKLPIPDHPVCCTQADIDNYIFEPGEDEREVGERLAASYVNFYFANGILLVPQFGGENEESDRRAVEILQELCQDREVIGIPARNILLGGGNIHCITQQIPASVAFGPVS